MLLRFCLGRVLRCGAESFQFLSYCLDDLHSNVSQLWFQEQEQYALPDYCAQGLLIVFSAHNIGRNEGKAAGVYHPPPTDI